MSLPRHVPWLAALAVMIFSLTAAGPGLAQVPEADRLASKPAPASADPQGDLDNAGSLTATLEAAVAGRDPACLTPAEAATLAQIASLLDGVRAYIDSADPNYPGWTGSGFPTHGDIPGHGPATPAEQRLDRLKTGYWALRTKYEALARLPACAVPPPPQAQVQLPAPSVTQPSDTSAPKPPAGGGPSLAPPDTPPLPVSGDPFGLPKPPDTACFTEADAVYQQALTSMLESALSDRQRKVQELRQKMVQIAALEAAAVQAGQSPDSDPEVASAKSDLPRLEEEVEQLDAKVFVVQAALAKSHKPPCPDDTVIRDGPTGGDGYPYNVIFPPPLPPPLVGPCRTDEDNAYEQALGAALDQLTSQRESIYTQMTPLVLQLYAIYEGGGQAFGTSGLLAQLDELQHQVDVLDTWIYEIRQRLEHPRPPCDQYGHPLGDGGSAVVGGTGGSNSTGQIPGPATSPSGDQAVEQKGSTESGHVLKGVGVEPPPVKQPNRREGEDQGDENGGQSSPKD